MNELTNIEILSPLSIAQQQRAIEIRNTIIHDSEKPKYLLALEINRFFQHVDDERALMLFETLWNTGGRINEVLELTPESFIFGIHTNHVRMLNLKRRRKNKKTDENLIVKESYRMIPLTDKKFIQRIQRYINTFKIKKNEKLFSITDRTARNWIKKTVENAEKEGVIFTIDITPHTFRHSYAMHLLYNGIKPTVLQKLLGHSSYNNTQKYIDILAIEAVQQDNIQFLY